MISGIKFSKMQALGNDFVIISDLTGQLALSRNEIRALCDRRRGIGADGLLLLQPSAPAAFLMRVLNSDGTEAEMCGNGIRCAAKYAFDTRLAHQKQIQVETLAGIKNVEIVRESKGLAETIKVDLGEPDFTRAGEKPPEATDCPIFEPLELNGVTIDLIALSMGNPHAVVFVEDADAADVAGLGPAIERHVVFPARTNVEFSQIMSRGRMRLRVWERGAGETQACGTGAAAAVAAAHRAGMTDSCVTVSLPGGDLTVELASNGHAFITGGATLVYSGTTGDAA